MTCGADGLCRSSSTDNCAAINDAGGDPDAVKFCFGTGLIRDVCVEPPLVPVTYENGMLSTSDNNCSFTRVQADGTTLCFFVYTSILFGGNLRVVGPNPAVFVGLTDVTVRAGSTLDVSSKAADVLPGAGGAGAVGCASALSIAGSGDNQNIAGSGGAGGSFTGFGGVGGDATYGNAMVDVIISGGAIGGVVGPLTAVRGGCPGGHGGKGAIGGVFPRGGSGGGAVYLIAGGAVRVHGTINASGAGGDAPTLGGGGGGGGTGGMIGFDAPTYDVSSAKIFAVGGSGASGATASSAGQPGNEPTMPMTAGTTLAPSGAGIGGGGGDFAAGASGGTAIDGGGGGGGGSTGYIGFAGALPTDPTAMFAPMPEVIE
jgi:hypothetical protein